MEILNINYGLTLGGQLIVGIAVTAMICCVFIGLIKQEDNNVTNVCVLIGIISAVVLIFASYMLKENQYEILLTDVTYNELVEDYEVIDTKGKILIVREKEK